MNKYPRLWKSVCSISAFALLWRTASPRPAQQLKQHGLRHPGPDRPLATQQRLLVRETLRRRRSSKASGNLSVIPKTFSYSTFSSSMRRPAGRVVESTEKARA
jgi:hypothetical protein